MMKYSEIKLDDNQKTLLTVFKASGYKSIGNDDMHGLVMSNGSKAVSLYGLKDFDWIETNSYYEIDKLLNLPQEPKTVWDLKDGDAFWCIGAGSYIYKHTWHSAELAVEYRNQGNVFLTEEEAKFAVKRREVVAKVRKYTRPFIPNEENWTLYWDCKVKIIHKYYVNTTQEARLYFESKEKIEQAIDEVGEEDFKKYYLGVTE